MPPGAIQSLFLDGSDTLWIGTSRGIAFLQSGVVHVPLGAPAAIYGDILGIAEKNGWLWVATSDHILRVRCSALLKQEYAEGDYREFGVTDGLPSVDGVKRSPAVELDDRGNISGSHLNREFHSYRLRRLRIQSSPSRRESKECLWMGSTSRPVTISIFLPADTA
jgi:ligand-binding sensor domain-containing protein